MKTSDEVTWVCWSSVTNSRGWFCGEETDVTLRQGFHDLFLLIQQCFHRFFISESTCSYPNKKLLLSKNNYYYYYKLFRRLHLSVEKAKQQRHAQALTRSDYSGCNLVYGLPRSAGFWSEWRHNVLEPE